MDITSWGALAFGLVIGWVTHRTVVRKSDAVALSDIAAVIAAVGGAAVVALFKLGPLFGAYCIGLAIGFFAYFIIRLILYGKEDLADTMGK